MTITVPVPSRDLCPNARGHWGKKERATKAAKIAAIAAVYRSERPSGTAFLMDVRWFGKSASVLRMDDDNAWATLKATRDGIAHALNIDDKAIRQGTLEIARDAANPRVEITLTERT